MFNVQCYEFSDYRSLTPAFCINYNTSLQQLEE